jgi:ribosomal protein S18 acetylase RimI-like enzyme
MRSATEASTGEIALRRAAADDREFLLGVYASTRDEELSQVEWAPGQREAFLRMQFDAQDGQYRLHNPNGAFDVIEVDGQRAGRLYVDRRPTDIRIIDISLLPEFRGAGIGGRLIARLQEEAAAGSRTVSIHVEIHNRAAELYRRLGFVVAAELGVYRRMEWTAL